MAVQVGKPNGSNGRRRAYRPMSEINVTPFVDVMLVLLVIFMVAAPLLTVAVPVDLPRSDAASIGQPDKPLIVSVTAKGEIYLQETELPIEELIPRLGAIVKQRPDVRIYVRGDRTVPYGRVLEVMGALTSAGFQRVALVSEGSATAPPAEQ